MGRRASVLVYMDDALKRRIKHLAVDRGISATDLCVEFITSGIRRALPAPPRPDHEPPPVPGANGG